MLFLAGLAFVNLGNMSSNRGVEVRTSDALAGVNWRPTHIGEMPLPDENPLFLHFEPDGALRGNAGCNRFSGEYVVADNRITVSPLISTRMACAGSAGTFESSFLEALQSMQSAVRSDDQLAIRDASGTVVSRFVALQTVTDNRQ